MSVEPHVRGPLDKLEHTTAFQSINSTELHTVRISAQTIPYILSTIDALVIMLCSMVASVAYPLASGSLSTGLPSQFGVGLLACMFYVLGMHRGAFYDLAKTAKPKLEVREIVVRWVVTGLLLAFVAFLLKIGDLYSRGTFVTFLILAPLALIFSRKLAKNVLSLAVSKGLIGRRDTVLLGDFDEMLALKSHDLLTACGASDVNRFALSRADNVETRKTDDIRAIDNLAHFVRLHDCRQILLALPWSDSDRIEFVRDRIKALPIAARLLPDQRARSLSESKWSTRSYVLPIDVQRAPLSGPQQFFKRTVDILVSGVALTFFIPVILLTAIAIRLDSPGPIIFRQSRRGFNGKKFVIFKFRTMTVQENGSSVVQATRGDSRVTRLGGLLRSSSVDELPQLINVLMGDMSLVGPRPHALAHDDYFESIVGDYAFRHHVKPGITGWAQCNGARGATPSIEHISERVKLDLWYVNNWSLGLDIQILLKTIFEVVRKRNAY